MHRGRLSRAAATLRLIRTTITVSTDLSDCAARRPKCAVAPGMNRSTWQWRRSQLHGKGRRQGEFAGTRCCESVLVQARSMQGPHAWASVGAAIRLGFRHDAVMRAVPIATSTSPPAIAYSIPLVAGNIHIATRILFRAPVLTWVP
jgi:hypothetical protein